jgi:plasmid stabilization system protein ParE
MRYEIRWAPEAEKTFSANLEYLSKNWNPTVVRNFGLRVNLVLEQVADNPYLYSIFRESDKVRRCVVHERIVLFYRIVDEKTIHLLTFWNTYQDLES